MSRQSMYVCSFLVFSFINIFVFFLEVVRFEWYSAILLDIRAFKLNCYQLSNRSLLCMWRICAGCNTEIGHGRFLSCMGAVWHPECFRCHACNQPISDYEVIFLLYLPYRQSFCSSSFFILKPPYLRKRQKKKRCNFHFTKNMTSWDLY